MGPRPMSAPILESKRCTLARSEDATRDMLAVSHLTAGYGASAAVRDVTLRVGPGEAGALLGRNGAGKSTTLMAVAGGPRAPSRSGQVHGQSVSALPSHSIGP